MEEEELWKEALRLIHFQWRTLRPLVPLPSYIVTSVTFVSWCRLTLTNAHIFSSSVAFQKNESSFYDMSERTIWQFCGTMKKLR
jgi:hypothetical protein